METSDKYDVIMKTQKYYNLGSRQVFDLQFFLKLIIFQRFFENLKGKRVQLESTPKNIATVPNPGKQELIKAHKSRFLDKK